MKENEEIQSQLQRMDDKLDRIEGLFLNYARATKDDYAQVLRRIEKLERIPPSNGSNGASNGMHS